MNRRGFLGVVAKIGALAALPVTVAYKHIPWNRLRPITQRTVKLGNGWVCTTKTYGNGWVVMYDHNGSVNINLISEQRVEIQSPDGLQEIRDLMITA